MLESLVEYGYWGLLAASFLAATILPFSSELVLSLLVASGADIWWCVGVASLGNWGGGITNYWLGHLGKWEWIEKYLKVKRSKIETIAEKVQNRGAFIAFWSWLPVIGDPLALALGLLRAHFWSVAAAMLTGKTLRYIVWALTTLEVITWFQPV